MVTGVCVSLHSKMFCVDVFAFVITGWQRPLGCLISIGHSPQKNSVISGSFAEINLQLKASYGSSPPCTKLEVLW